MDKSFSELVIKGNFPLVKGFIAGYLGGRGSDAEYFFCHKAGTIRRDTVTGMIRQLAELDSEVHVCFESNELDEFKKVVGMVQQRIGIDIVQADPITGAEFDYSLELYDAEDANVCKELLRKTGEKLELLSFNEQETIDDKAMKDPLHRAHPYTYSSAGRIKGDFKQVMDVFLEMKRLPFRDFIKCGDMILRHS